MDGTQADQPQRRAKQPKRWQEYERPYAKLANAIRKARLAMNDGAGLSQEALSARIGGSPAYISGLESGTRRPRPHYLEQIARVAGADLTELAELAGYRTSLPGDLNIAGSGAEASLLRQYAEYPPYMLQLGLDLLRRIERELPHPDDDKPSAGESAA